MPETVAGPEDLPGMQAFQVLVDTVARGIEAGVFVEGDPVEVAIGLWSTTHGFVTLVHFEDEMPEALPIRQAMERVLDQGVRGVLRTEA